MIQNSDIFHVNSYHSSRTMWLNFLQVWTQRAAHLVYYNKIIVLLYTVCVTHVQVMIIKLDLSFSRWSLFDLFLTFKYSQDDSSISDTGENPYKANVSVIIPYLVWSLYNRNNYGFLSMAIIPRYSASATESFAIKKCHNRKCRLLGGYTASVDDLIASWAKFSFEVWQKRMEQLRKSSHSF